MSIKTVNVYEKRFKYTYIIKDLKLCKREQLNKVHGGRQSVKYKLFYIY